MYVLCDVSQREGEQGEQQGDSLQKHTPGLYSSVTVGTTQMFFLRDKKLWICAQHLGIDLY